MTSPQTWSPHATLAATKMFVSQLHAKQAQRFLNLVLLNVVRDDIREHRRLHFALFQAVKKAVFKPGAFYKGFILPLLKQGDCTLREAVILSAVLNRVSIPMDHSAAVRPPSPCVRPTLPLSRQCERNRRARAHQDRALGTQKVRRPRMHVACSTNGGVRWWTGDAGAGADADGRPTVLGSDELHDQNSA